jgi:hypothetical protein
VPTDGGSQAVSRKCARHTPVPDGINFAQNTAYYEPLETHKI